MQNTKFWKHTIQEDENKEYEIPKTWQVLLAAYT